LLSIGVSEFIVKNKKKHEHFRGWHGWTVLPPTVARGFGFGIALVFFIFSLDDMMFSLF
jgi:hypothetical protein